MQPKSARIVTVQEIYGLIRLAVTGIFEDLFDAGGSTRVLLARFRPMLRQRPSSSVEMCAGRGTRDSRSRLELLMSATA